MIDLHTHSLYSDGELLPSELIRRATVAGYRALAITDHGDHSNIDFIIPRLARMCRELSGTFEITVIPGIELTHVPPSCIGELAAESRALGARIIVVHGETIAEPVSPETNHAALKAGIDILAHPGLLTEEEAKLAAHNGVYLEITTRKGHSLTNGHVATMARRTGAKLLLNTDSHSPADLVSRTFAEKIARGAGLTTEEVSGLFENSRILVQKLSV